MEIPADLTAPGTADGPFEALARLDALPPGTMLRVTRGDLDILLAHTPAGICATDDRCPHMAAPLSVGNLADCIVAGRAEIGIETAPEHRRRGLATQVTAAAVAMAFDRGLTEVGWHCNDDNTGSYRTAESVGFRLARRYDLLAGRPHGMGEGR
jgi:RimJ/RimL family protein N-acetyltransferase